MGLQRDPSEQILETITSKTKLKSSYMLEDIKRRQAIQARSNSTYDCHYSGVRFGVMRRPPSYILPKERYTPFYASEPSGHLKLECNQIASSSRRSGEDNLEEFNQVHTSYSTFKATE